MIGGIATLIISGVLALSITEYGTDAIVKAEIRKMYQKGESKDSLIRKIENGPWSSKLKAKAISDIRRY